VSLEGSGRRVSVGGELPSSFDGLFVMLGSALLTVTTGALVPVVLASDVGNGDEGLFGKVSCPDSSCFS
jgi:hypothetical protein